MWCILSCSAVLGDSIWRYLKSYIYIYISYSDYISSQHVLSSLQVTIWSVKKTWLPRMACTADLKAWVTTASLTACPTAASMCTSACWLVILSNAGRTAIFLAFGVALRGLRVNFPPVPCKPKRLQSRISMLVFQSSTLHSQHVPAIQSSWKMSCMETFPECQEFCKHKTSKRYAGRFKTAMAFKIIPQTVGIRCRRPSLPVSVSRFAIRWKSSDQPMCSMTWRSILHPECVKTINQNIQQLLDALHCLARDPENVWTLMKTKIRNWLKHMKPRWNMLKHMLNTCLKKQKKHVNNMLTPIRIIYWLLKHLKCWCHDV